MILVSILTLSLYAYGDTPTTVAEPHPKSTHFQSHFVTTDLQGKHHTLRLKEQGLSHQEAVTPDVMVVLFTSWCTPCKGMLPYLQDIQNKYANQLTTIGIVAHDQRQPQSLQTLLQTLEVTFPVIRDHTIADAIAQSIGLPANYPLPTIILYHNGRYHIHYEGATPPEMIIHDITTLKDH